MRERKEKKNKAAHPYYETEKVYVLSLLRGDLYGLSELSNNEINAITALLGLYHEYKVDIIPSLVENYIRLKVSHKREGRKELLKVGGTKTSNILQLFTRKKTPSEVYEPVE